MRFLYISILVLFAPVGWSDEVDLVQTCNSPFGAKLVSLQGKVFVDLVSNGHWQQSKLNDFFCEGSRLRVEAYSRASLSLPNNIELRLDEGTVLTLNGLSPTKPTLLDLIKGFVHFLSRTPKRLEITSPIANAGPEGTEFAMQVAEDSCFLVGL